MSRMLNATYDKPHVEMYGLPSSAFGATTATRTVIGPKGKRGKVVDILVDITADMVGTTTVPEIDVGSASGLVEYARYRLGTTAILGYLAAATPKRATQEGLSTKLGTAPHLSDYAGHVALETAELPKDTAFVITAKQGSGGSPAGTGTAVIVVEWY